ncbi:TRAP transporter substrate-binding protein [Hominifimenecus sp. rT4P-3]|uniref:TRAP transporter substrate-binding protein n=1 Tax=Hominifimenecus sp. rT4P-3 TaxID=3242979 RepID=UPI003DA3A34A
MKRMSAAILAMVMMLAVVSCGSGTSADTTAAKAESVSASAQESGEVSQAENSEGESYHFIYAADCAEDTVQGLMIKHFAEQLEERSGGRMTVQLHFSGSMGSDIECCESCQSGDITFYNSAVSTTSNFIDDVTAIDLPFLYSNVNVYRKAMDNETVNKYFAQCYEDNGFHLLGFYDQGMRQTTSNVEIHSVQDLSGLKIRVMDNAFHVSIWKALGANPTPMAMSEVYIGLQQGTIDAQENGVEVVYANKVYEQQKYMVMTNHLPSSMVFLMNQGVYQSLSAEDQKLIDEVGVETIQYARNVCDERQEGRKELMSETGIQFVELEQSVLEEMKAMCQAVYDSVRAEYGNEIVDMLMKAVENAE